MSENPATGLDSRPRHFGIVTLFPEMFSALSGSGISRRAFEQARYSLSFHDPRQWAEDAHRTVDDRPYGGGPGMVMMAAPLAAALQSARDEATARTGQPARVIHLSPAGRPLNHAGVLALAAQASLVLLCSRYEGVDQRLIDQCVDEEVSIGDYVLSGGELPAMVLLDAIIRQLPGVLNHEHSARDDSFVDGLLDCPHFTRPESFGGTPVPPVLTSGNHAAIRRWRRQQALGRTAIRRPDLLAQLALGKEDHQLLEEYRHQMEGTVTGVQAGR